MRIDLHIHLHPGGDPETLDAIATLTSLVSNQGATMTDALGNLEAAETAEEAAITSLEAEQTTFLADVAAALSAAGTDPAALQAVADRITAESARISALQAAQVAADPATPPAA